MHRGGMLRLSSLTVASLAILGLAGCQQRIGSNKAVETSPQPQAITFSDGLEKITNTIEFDGHTYTAVVFRLKKDLYTWSVHYESKPKTLRAWFEDLDSSLVVNGSFFTETYVPTGYFSLGSNIINDASYTGGNIGTVVIKDGMISLSPSIPQPAQTVSVFQSFPLLLRPGAQTTIETDTEKIARRTILGQDNNGHTLVILFDTSPITLHDAAHVLLALELNIAWAINLDGGPSTGAIAKENGQEAHILPAAELPIVLSAKKVSAASPNGR